MDSEQNLEFAQVKKLFEKDILVIKLAHTGQLYNQRPYWHHPVRVALRLRHFLRLAPVYESSRSVIQAALLHDTLEDTELTADGLRLLGYGDDTIGLVQILTRDDDTTYADFIQKVIESRSEAAMFIKLADLYENSNNLRFIPAEKRSRMVRYGKAIHDIQDALYSGKRPTDLANLEIISGELEKNEIETWIGEPPAFL